VACVAFAYGLCFRIPLMWLAPMGFAFAYRLNVAFAYGLCFRIPFECGLRLWALLSHTVCIVACAYGLCFRIPKCWLFGVKILGFGICISSPLAITFFSLNFTVSQYDCV
jgi:hypothetical protein